MVGDVGRGKTDYPEMCFLFFLFFPGTAIIFWPLFDEPEGHPSNKVCLQDLQDSAADFLHTFGSFLSLLELWEQKLR